LTDRNNSIWAAWILSISFYFSVHASVSCNSMNVVIVFSDK
jgi:hypothetical protein